MRAYRLGISKEEKIAKNIGLMLSDFSIDLEAVGFYIARATPYTIFRRALEVLESAEYNKEAVDYNLQSRFYSDRLF